MRQNKSQPPPLPPPTPAEIERAKTDADARKRVSRQIQRVKRREEEIAQWVAENADAGVCDLGGSLAHDRVVHNSDDHNDDDLVAPDYDDHDDHDDNDQRNFVPCVTDDRCVQRG